MRASLQLAVASTTAAAPTGRSVTRSATCLSQRRRRRAGGPRCARRMAEDGGGGEGDPIGRDPVGDALQAARELGYQVVFEEEEEEDWDDILEDLDDPWMREPPAEMEIEAFGAQSDPSAVEQQPSASPYSPEAGFEEVTAAEVRDMQAAGSPPVLLLDVRSSLEFDTRSIPGSEHVLLKDLTREKGEQLRRRGELALVVVGSGDHRSQQAAVRLKAVYGLPNVKHLTGGISEWGE
mmetsp:Transcript_19425/g.48845  ORF Transcript_19425/g.48845 Transcript_19425/m.48845 type:complete len:236 (+) Transcript_19425:282-989(+)